MLNTFKLGDKGVYGAFWGSCDASNAHLTKDSGRVAWILDAVGSVEPDSILEIGSQTGGVTRFLLEIAPVLAVDIAEKNLRIVEEMGATALLSFVEDLHRVVIGAFDSVVLTEVLNHVLDAEKATANAWARVKPGGNLVVTVPIGNRWTDQSTAREFNQPEDLIAILRVATGYKRVVVETLSHDGVGYFYACNLKRRRRRAR